MLWIADTGDTAAHEAWDCASGGGVDEACLRLRRPPVLAGLLSSGVRDKRFLCAFRDAFGNCTASGGSRDTSKRVAQTGETSGYASAK